MAKAISQETFDGVVKENMEEFEMSREEAINDAVEQFEAQGIDLSNIVRDHTLGGSEEVHPVIVAVKALSDALSAESQDFEAIKQYCSEIKTQCDIDLAHRCLAGKNECYGALKLAWKKCADNLETCVSILKAMCALTSGQPDLLESEGMTLSVALLKSASEANEDDLLCLTLEFIKNNCEKHEINRQKYVANGIIALLINILDKKRSKKNVVVQACCVLRVLTNDDDVRATFGKAHEHAKMIVTEENGLKHILDLCKEYISEKAVLAILFSTLTRLAVRNEFCQQVMDQGGLQLVLDTLAEHVKQPVITKQALGILKALAGNDIVKSTTVSNGGLELVILALQTHLKNPALCEIGCSAVATIVLRNPSHCQHAIEAGAADILIKVVQQHPDRVSTLKQACMAIRNLVARTRQYCQIFLDLEVEPLLQKALQTHEGCRDEVKAALRDLGCNVTLQERWTGEGKGIKY